MEKLILSNQKLPVIRDGIVKGMEVASGAKSSSTYYHKKKDQVAAVKQSVTNLYGISKELPLILACQKGVTGFFIQEVLLNEFKKTANGGSCEIVNPKDWHDEGLGNRAIVRALHALDTDSGITYVLRLFTQFKDDKINNARARKIALSFIWRHPNLEFIAVKYRNKLQKILVHIYGTKMNSTLLTISQKFVDGNGLYSGEKAVKIAEMITKYTSYPHEAVFRYFLFINGKATKEYFKYAGEYPVMNQYFEAKEDIGKGKLLPEEILIGLIGDPLHPQHSSKWGNDDLKKKTKKEIRELSRVTTANQAVRQTKSSKKLGVKKEVSLSKVTDFLALYKTGYEDKFTVELKKSIDELAEKKKMKDFPYQNIAVIVDKSSSMRGHKTESKNTPKAVSEFTSLVLEKSVKTVKKFESSEIGSDIASAFIDAISESDSYDAMFILSDGYENSYDGLLDEVITTWRSMTNNVVPIYHLSPITGSEVKAKVRSFGNQVSTMAISRPESLLMQLNSKLLEQDPKRWLEKQVQLLERNKGQ